MQYVFYNTVKAKYRLNQNTTATANCFRLFTGCFKTLLEFVYTTAGIDEFLLTRKKRMALGANINMHVSACALGLYLCAACTSYNRVLIIRMDTLLHVLTPPNSIFILTFYVRTDAKPQYIGIITHLNRFCNSFLRILFSLSEAPFNARFGRH